MGPSPGTVIFDESFNPLLHHQSVSPPPPARPPVSGSEGSHLEYNFHIALVRARAGGHTAGGAANTCYDFITSPSLAILGHVIIHTAQEFYMQCDY